MIDVILCLLTVLDLIAYVAQHDLLSRPTLP